MRPTALLFKILLAAPAAAQRFELVGVSLLSLATAVSLACSDGAPPPLTVTGHWAGMADDGYQIEWSMTLTENEGGAIAGSAIEDRPAALGGRGYYLVSGQRGPSGVTLDFDTQTFTPGPTFNGDLVHRDTLRGTIWTDRSIAFHRTTLTR